MDQSRIPFPFRGITVSVLLVLALTACSGEKPEAMLASARDYMAKDDLKAAVIQIKNALQEKPDLGEGRYLLGLALLRGGDPVGAETELRKAMALFYSEDKTLPSLAQAMLAQGQYKKLIEEFANTPLSEPSAKADLLTTLSSAYQAERNPEMAKSTLDAALLADPSNVSAQLLTVRSQAGKGDLDGAIVAVDAILAKTPASYQAQKLKGDLLAAKLLSNEAIAAYRKAIEIKPDLLLARLAILSILMQDGKLEEAGKELAAVKQQAPNSPSTRYLETQLAYEQKDFKKAKELAQQLLTLASDNVQALTLAGAIELQIGTVRQAETYLSTALSIRPQASLVRRLLTTSYLRLGQLDKAMATLQPLLKDADTSPAISALAGEAFLQTGDIKKAEEYFAKAARQDPKNTRAKTALALTQLAAGNASGLSDLQAIADADSGTVADMALISVNLRRGEFDKALKAIDGLEKKQPKSPLASGLRARTLLAKKDVAGARKAFERAIEIDPMYMPAISSLAALDLADKKPELARKRFEAVLAKEPKQPQALLALAELRAREGGGKEEVAELISRAITANPTDKVPRLLLVELHLRSKDVKLALSAAQNAVAAIPDSHELLDALGRAQLASGDTNQALNTFKKFAGMQPGSPLPQLRLAEAYLLTKDKSGATQSLRRALDIKPDFLDAQRGLMLLAMDAKNYAEATVIARSVQKQRPQEVVGYQFEGDIAAMQKKWDVAGDAYRAGLKQGAFSTLAVSLHGTLMASGKAAEADKFAANWLSANPKDTVMRMRLAGTVLATKDFVGAEKLYQEVIQIEPINAIAFNNLAWITGQLKKDGAIAYAEKAIALVPTQPAYMDTLAMLLLDKGDNAKALEWQNKAVALQPATGIYKLNLAKIHIKSGNKDLARKELDELAKLGDKFVGQAQVAELRKSL